LISEKAFFESIQTRTGCVYSVKEESVRKKKWCTCPAMKHKPGSNTCPYTIARSWGTSTLPLLFILLFIFLTHNKNNVYLIEPTVCCDDLIFFVLKKTSLAFYNCITNEISISITSGY